MNIEKMSKEQTAEKIKPVLKALEAMHPEDQLAVLSFAAMWIMKTEGVSRCEAGSPEYSVVMRRTKDCQCANCVTQRTTETANKDTAVNPVKFDS